MTQVDQCMEDVIQAIERHHTQALMAEDLKRRLPDVKLGTIKRCLAKLHSTRKETKVAFCIDSLGYMYHKYFEMIPFTLEEYRAINHSDPPPDYVVREGKPRNRR